jgi:hypothetical protein
VRVDVQKQHDNDDIHIDAVWSKPLLRLGSCSVDHAPVAKLVKLPQTVALEFDAICHPDQSE